MNTTNKTCLPRAGQPGPAQLLKRVVIADTGPILYLHLIDKLDIIPALFNEINIPTAVYDELCHPGAPSSLRAWALTKPTWLRVSSTAEILDIETAFLDKGEREAIALANTLAADLVLMDDRKGVRVALLKGFEVTGTLGILDLAARRSLIDLEEAFDRLKATNFRYSPQMLEDMLNRYRMG